MGFRYNWDSLTRHKVTALEVRQVLADIHAKEEYLDEPSERGNPRSVTVGKTEADRTLEIFIEYMEDECDEDIINVYHSESASDWAREFTGYGTA